MRIDTCKGCTERYLGCHDHCEKYKEAYKREKLKKDAADKQRNINYLLRGTKHVKR